MAHKRATTGKTEQQSPQIFKGFVTFDLTDEQWDEFDKAFPRAFTAPKVWDDLLTGNKLTVTPREGNYNACIFPQSGDNAGFALSAFADSAFEAMAIVIFKFNIIRDTSWKNLGVPGKKRRG